VTAQHKKIGLFILVDDLRAGAGVSVWAGALIHPPGCQRPHAPVPFIAALDGISGDTYMIRLLVYRPPVHPKVIAVFPEISSLTFPEHSHLFRNRPPREAVPELLTLNPRLLARFLPELIRYPVSDASSVEQAFRGAPGAPSPTAHSASPRLEANSRESRRRLRRRRRRAEVRQRMCRETDASGHP